MTEPTTEVTVPAGRLVTLADGRLGWAGVPDVPDGSEVRVSTGDQVLEGTARVVRSGAAYEEVCGRVRQAGGWRARWARRPDVVVLVSGARAGGAASSEA